MRLLPCFVDQQVFQRGVRVFAQFFEQGSQLGHGAAQLALQQPGHQRWVVSLGFSGFGAVVLEPGDVEVVATGGNLFAGELAPAA
ncbi:hypothetical protein D9M69_712370 [compost metagenome]